MHDRSNGASRRRTLLRAGWARACAALLIALASPLAGPLPPAPARAVAPAPSPSTAPAPTVLSLTASPSRVAAGTAVTVTTSLRRAADGAPVAGQTVELWAAPARTTAWVPIAAGTTDGSGRTATRYQVPAHTDLRATSAGSTSVAAATSPVRRVEAAARVVATLSAAAVRARTSAAVTGTVSPARAGDPVTLWLRSRGAWRALATVPQSATGAFRFAVTPATPGWWRYRVTTPGDRSLRGAEHVLPALDAYVLHTYVVTRRGTTSSLDDFASVVASTFADPRGWPAAHRRFSRVATGGEFTVVLAEARYLPRFSPACSVLYSCRVGRHVVINDARWRSGSRAFPGPLDQYRAMVVNHETGHWLGLGHATCPRPRTPAPVMQQQSKSLQGCTPNAWPLAAEVAAATPRR